MKKRPPSIQPDWDIVFPMIIARWRKLLKIPLGPEDRLQTREFQSVVNQVLEYKKTGDLSTPEAVGSYFMYQWPLHYAEGLSLIKELPKVPTRVLELGALGAPFSFAAIRSGATEAFALDENELALRWGADICGHLGYPISVRTCDSRRLKELPVEGLWDLIILPYSLFKFFKSLDTQIPYIQKLLKMLSSEGHLLIVESSATEVNRKFLELRDAIAAQNISIAAPCLWRGNCPALKHSSTPCFAQRPLDKPPMIKDIQRACQINLSSLKTSYLLLRSPWSAVPALQDNLYRVVSPPVDTYKGERFFLCGVKGKKTIGSTLTTHPKQSRAFEYLKRGDVIAVNNAPELDNDLQITENTEVTLYAPCDKPVPNQN